MMGIFAERRFGQFRITSRLMKGAPEMVQALLSQVIVVRCEYLFAAGAWDYTAWGSEFPLLLDGCEPTRYGLVVDHAKEYLRFILAESGQIVTLEPAEEIVS